MKLIKRKLDLKTFKDGIEQVVFKIKCACPLNNEIPEVKLNLQIISLCVNDLIYSQYIKPKLSRKSSESQKIYINNLNAYNLGQRHCDSAIRYFNGDMFSAELIGINKEYIIRLLIKNRLLMLEDERVL